MPCVRVTSDTNHDQYKIAQMERSSMEENNKKTKPKRMGKMRAQHSHEIAKCFKEKKKLL